MDINEIMSRNYYNNVFKKILEMADDGFIVVNTKGIVTDINNAYCEFLGRTKDSIIGRPITDTISNTKMNEIIRTKRTDIGDIHKFIDGETANNRDTILWVTRAPVEDENGDVIAAVAQVKFRKTTLENAQRLMDLYMELQYYKNEITKLGNDSFELNAAIGESPAFISTKELAFKASKNNFPVLLTGETGVGKEVFTNLIHQYSLRADNPLIKINCGAIPSDLLESELFGYEEGAFTGAKKGGKIGKFELANGGTLFLDEIGDMPLSMQVKLLRVLQEKEIERVGGNTTIPVDVKIIAATRHNLKDKILAKEFREDLYYRLNVININVPSLVDRKEDIPLLTHYILDGINQKYKTNVDISDDAILCLMNHYWPGNIRELSNVIKSVYALIEGHTIDVEHLPSNIVKTTDLATHIKDSGSLNASMDSFEKELILRCLKKNKYNLTRVSKELDIHRSNLYKKIAKYDIDLDKLKKLCQAKERS